jgi:hypothetical protein
MKKVLSLVTVMLIAITSYAQAPFVVYKSVPDPPRSSSSLPDFYFSDPMEDIMRRKAAQAAAHAKAMEIISSDIITADGFNLLNDTYSPLKVRVIHRRNGQVDFQCLGIKKNGTWSSCEQEIASLEIMYQKATKESDKRTILELMEYGNYLLIVNPNSEIYLIK